MRPSSTSSVQRCSESLFENNDIIIDFNTETIPSVQAAQVQCNDAVQQMKQEVKAVESIYSKVLEQEKLRTKFASQFAGIRAMLNEFNEIRPLLEATAANVNKITDIEGEIAAVKLALQDQQAQPASKPIVTDEKIKALIKKALGIGQPQLKFKNKQEGVLKKIVNEIVEAKIKEFTEGQLDDLVENRVAEIVEAKVQDMANKADIEGTIDEEIEKQMKEEEENRKLNKSQIKQVMDFSKRRQCQQTKQKR